MNGNWSLAAVLLLSAVALAWVFVERWKKSRATQRTLQVDRAIAEFADQRDDLTGLLLRTAGASGKPRGLRWTGCELSGPPIFAVDESNGELIALVSTTISFAAIEGGGMEEVEAVANLRSATAVFMHRGKGWETDGRVIFNLEPAEAIARFTNALRPIEPRDE
jgi:hypothetical protein